MNNSKTSREDKDLIVISDDATTSSAVILSGSSISATAAALSVVSDSLRILSAFAWGKEGRLSKNKSAQLCDLMNAWN